MIGWSRLLDGRFRDPLVGRDILIGTLGGIVLTIILLFDWLVPTWLGLPAPSMSPRPASLAVLFGGRYTLFSMAESLESSVGAALIFLLLLFLFTAILRDRRIAVVASAAFATVVSPMFARGNPAVDLAVSVLWAAAVVFVLVRFGLLPLLAASVASTFLYTSVSFDSRVPYALWSYLLVGTILALAAYEFHTALAGRPMFGGGF